MEEVNLGRIIRHLRNVRKMSQEQLAEGICSTSQLYRIEKGKHFPSVFILKQISEKLSEDVSKYFIYSNCTDPIYFSNLFSKLNHLFLRRRFTEILEIINEIRRLEKYGDDLDLPSIKQLLGWYEGASLVNTGNSNISVDYYLDLLKLTSSFTDLDELLNTLITTSEIRLIHSIVASYCRLNELDTAKKLIYSLLSNIETYNVDLDVSLITQILFNLSKLLFLEEEYDESISHATKGLDICNKYDFSPIMADLFYIRGECYEGIGNKEEAVNNFNKFICLYDILGHDEFSTKCKEELLEKYQDVITTL